MRMIFAFTMVLVTVLAMLLFIETIHIKFFTEKQTHGTFAYITAENGGNII